jgi:AraC-like DNA-binding protein
VSSARRADPIADVLEIGRVRGALVASVWATAPWGLAVPQSGGAALHAVVTGEAWVRVPDQAPVRLLPGDVAVLPSGSAHRFSSDLGVACRPFDRATKERLVTPDGVLDLRPAGTDDDAATTTVCAAFDYDLDAARPVMRLLPTLLHVTGGPDEEVATLVRLLASEAGTRCAGSRVATARLVDLLLLAVLRRWATDPTLAASAPPSWLTALRDGTVAEALALLHGDPGRPWTLATLAGELHTSRATLARRFGDAVGEPPLTYLTRWRMHLAEQRLLHSTDTIDAIARDVGYSSEYAFNRAFARQLGSPPGRYRRAAQRAS